MKRFVIPVLVVLACAGWAPSAFAAGGATIGSAPTITYGQQEFGNTATDDPQNECSGGPVWPPNSWWLLPVTAGDQITVNFESNTDVAADLFSSGTNDFNWDQFGNDKVANADNGGYGGSQILYTAPSDGTMPLEFAADYCDNTPGPYDFTVYDLHALVLGKHFSTNRHRHHTSVSIGVHNPDGVPISGANLHVAVKGAVTGGFAASGSFSFGVTWGRRDRGRWETVHITVSGPSYQTTSTTVRVLAE